MGCVTTKFLNDGGTDSGGDLVKTVYRADANIYEEIKKPSKVVTKITDHLTKPNIFTKNHVKRKNAEADRNCDVPKIKQPRDDIAAVHTTPVVDPIEAKRERFKAKFDPRVTSKYDIKALIGRGSFSRVVRVERRTTKEPYAIKMVDRKKGAGVCEAELSVLGRVRHANVIQLIEVFDTPDKLYMVTELATGGELFDRVIAKGWFTERDATHVLHMLLDGVRYLHGLGIAHRDLKPENLLYYHPGDNSKILITDFGLSASAKSSTEASEELTMESTCGTPEYIAPEILARKPYTTQVDLWAVGVITYILLSGTMPFDDPSRARMYRSIIKAKYSFVGEHWKDISAYAKDFIDKLFVVDYSERMSAASALRHPWITTLAATSSNKNLHRTISRNLLTGSALGSAASSRVVTDARSLRSKDSSGGGGGRRRRGAGGGGGGASSHGGGARRRRVLKEDIDELLSDPELKAELSSMSSGNSSAGSSTAVEV